MRKKLLLFLSFMLSLWSYGQFTFPTVTGPISVSGGTAENVPINDAANAAAVPAGLYDSFSVSVDWVSTNYAYASEADLTIITSGGNVTIDPPTTGSAYSEAATTLTFSGSLTSLYDPSVDGLLTLDLNQSWNPSDANWSNIVVTLFEAPTCPDPLDLGITNLTATTVDLGWSEFGTATTWNVEYGAAGFSQGSGAVVNTTSNPHNLTGLTPETVYEFYVQSDCGGTDQSNWVGPFEFTTPPTCPAPTDLAITNLTTTSADLGWTNGGSETAWNVEYGAAGFSQGSGTVVNTTSNPHNLTGLTAETAYEFYVQADCGGTDQSTWAGPFSFYTGYCLPSASGTATYIDNFTTSNGSTNISNLASGHTAGGYFDGTAQAVSSYELGSFDFNAEIVGGSAGFAIWIDWNNDLVFDDVTEKVFNTTGFGNGPFTGTISVPSGTSIGNYRMRITTDWNSSNPSDPCADRNRAEFEDYTLTITATPSCLPPSSLMASNITATSADLGWTNGGSETAWNIEYGPVGFTQGSGGTTVNATTNLHNLTGLTAETAYEFYVQADCGGTDQSTWAGPFAFTTPCNPYSIPYFEGFETGYTHNTDVGGCLSQEAEVGTQAWTANNTLTTYNRTPRTGDWNAFLRYSNTDWMFIPVQLVGGTSYMMDVYARQDGSTATNAKVEISYGTSGNAASMTDVIVAETGVVNNQYQLLTGTFTPATSGVYYIGIKGIVNGSPYYLSVDDISIYETPSCLPPSSLMASNITTTSADLGWTNGGSETAWNISWGTPGYTPGDGNEINTATVTSASYQITGLTANTDYDIYIQADCGGGDQSAWSGPLSISTECTATNVPYVQDFESVTTPGMPSCTSIENVGSGNDWETASVTDYGFNSTVLRYSWNSDNDADAWFYTQGINLTAGTAYKISYEYGSTTFEEKLKVAYGTSPSSIGMTTTLADHTIASGTLNPNTVLFTPGVTDVYYFGFNAHSDADKFYLHVDNIVVELVPPCLDPTDFVASNMTGSTVDLSWTANGTATEWNIEYGANGFTQGTGTTETGVTANPYTLTGLTQGADYDVYIQSDCGVNQGTWVGPLSFSTTTCTPTTGDTTAVACDSFDWFGTTYTASGTATHVLTNSAGCDSTVTLILTINISATGTDTQTACGSFTWIDGVEYTASNNTAMYTIVGGAANGCDSIVTLDLTINPVATGTDTQTACGSFTWIDGVEYTASNNTAMYTIVGGAANGCDSIVTLDLTINQVATGTDVQASCGPFTWIDGVEYTATNNTAMHTIVGGAANGCDSIVTLNLTVDTEVSRSEEHT